MSALRIVLAFAGGLAGGWGLWLLLDLDRSGLVSAALWAGGAVAAHDLVLAPVTVGVGLLLARLAPAGARREVAIVLATWALLTVAVANVTFFALGGRSDNPSLLTGDYVQWWLVGTALAAVAAGAVVWRARSREDVASRPRD